MLELVVAGYLQCQIVHSMIVEEDLHCFYTCVDTTKEYANTLKQFTSLGLIREIVVDQNKSLYCTNKESHYHLYIEDENKVIDIPTKNIDLNIPAIPACLKLHDIDVIVRIRTLKEKYKN